MQKNREILIVRLSAMGDVAMTLPVIEELKRANDKIGITILTQEMVVPLFAHIENVNVIGWDTKKEGSVVSVLKMFRRLKKKYNFSEVYDLHDVLRTKILRALFSLSGTKVYAIDKGRKEKKKLINGRKLQLKTTVERYVDTLKKGGLSLECTNKLTKKHFDIPEPIKNIVEKKDGVWIGVAPFAKHRGKAYPVDLMELVIEKLEAKLHNLTIFIFSGGGDELLKSEEMAKKCKNAITVFGKIKLDGELQLMSNIDCMITMDSSAMHFASAVGTPVVSVWGATHQYAGFLGYGQSPDNVVDVDLECRPCSIFGNKPCHKTGDSEYECMSKILPQNIAYKVLNIVNK